MKSGTSHDESLMKASEESRSRHIGHHTTNEKAGASGSRACLAFAEMRASALHAAQYGGACGRRAASGWFSTDAKAHDIGHWHFGLD